MKFLCLIHNVSINKEKKYINIRFFTLLQVHYGGGEGEGGGRRGRWDRVGEVEGVIRIIVEVKICRHTYELLFVVCDS